MRSSRPTGIPCRAAWVLLCTAAAAAAADPGGDEALEREVAQLRAELALAEGGAFYLRLDPVAGTLELALDGVVLERYAALAIERGAGRVALWTREAPPGWDRLAYSAGQLEPPRERDRIEILAPTAGVAVPSPTPPPIPPTAEESLSVPERWRVVFPRGLSLEVVSDGGARNRGPWQRLADAWSLWWRDRRSAVRSEADARVRLRVRLGPEDAADLYRALPPDVGLVVRGAAG